MSVSDKKSLGHILKIPTQKIAFGWIIEEEFSEDTCAVYNVILWCHKNDYQQITY